jgi:GDP-L-fucose synthase
MNNPERIVVTGAHGFAGGHIANALEQAGHEVIRWHRAVVDLENLEQVRDAMHEQRPNWVIHAAGRVRGIQGNSGEANNWTQLEANRSIGEHVLYAMKSAEVRNGIILGSSCQYPRHAEQPLRVESLGNGMFERTNWGYAAAKEHLRRLATQFGYTFLIPPNLFGPGDNYTEGEAHFFADFVRKISTVKRDGSVEHMGLPSTRREILYAPALGEMVANLISDPEVLWDRPVINASYGPILEFSLGEVWELLVKDSGKNPYVRWTGQAIGMPRKVMSSTRFLLGENSTPIDAWIRETLKDFEARFPEAMDTQTIAK